MKKNKRIMSQNKIAGMLRFDKRLPGLGGVCPVVTWCCETFSHPYEEGGNDSQDGERNSKYEEKKYDGGRELALL